MRTKRGWTWGARLVAAFLVVAPGAASAVAATRPGAANRATVGRLVEERIHGKSLEGNLAGNDPDRSVLVYLPPKYDAERTRRYPTLYVLSGMGDANTVWTKPWDDRNPGFATLPELMDGGIRSGTVEEMIVVIPDARTTFPGSFYTNSPVMGRWEDFIASDLVAFVDGKYRTLARPEARGLLGHSMGGHGAIKIAMRHPDVFSVAYGMNSALLGWGGDVSEQNPAFKTVVTLDPSKPLPTDDPYVFAIIGIGQAFSPNPSRPPFFADQPFRVEAGRLVRSDSVVAAWSSEMPNFMLGRYAENLRKLRGLRFDSAFVDEYAHIPTTSHAFSDSLSARDIPHEFEMYNGDHRNRLWGSAGRLYREALPYFSALLR